MNTIKKENTGFTQISNNLLNNENLSAKAKGLYAFLFSKPTGWDFSGDRIAKQFSDGRKSIYKGLIELEDNNYIKRKRLPNGKMEYFLLNKPNAQKSQEAQEEGSSLRLDKNNKKTSKNSLTLTSCPKRQRAERGSISNKERIVIKNNSNKDIADKSAGKQINELLKEFEPINPIINYGNKTQRKALEDMVKKFGFEKMLNTIKFAISIQGKKYAPIITTPIQLKNKLGELLVYHKKETNNPMFVKI